MDNELTTDELISLVRTVFDPREGDQGLAVLIDLPDDDLGDNESWRWRREVAARWAEELRENREALGLEDVSLIAYRNVGANNADLPDEMFLLPEGQAPPAHAGAVHPGWSVTLDQVLDRASILMALTELSATAPLKVIGRERGMRAVTMPGFSADMIPALRLDYGEIDARCRFLKELLDDATAAEVSFGVGDEAYHLRLDLRYRQAHASGGLQREAGQVGNLPSGETYIVPYEGERPGEPSTTEGLLPVELDGEVVLYRIEENRAVEVVSHGPVSSREAQAIRREPAYANLAELGFGLLAALGVQPCGELLLDEKLGLHIAFGRSDHFGGQVGPSDFTSPRSVVHIDRVYLPQTQPLVTVPSVVLERSNGGSLLLMREGEYALPLEGVRPSSSSSPGSSERD